MLVGDPPVKSIHLAVAVRRFVDGAVVLHDADYAVSLPGRFVAHSESFFAELFPFVELAVVQVKNGIVLFEFCPECLEVVDGERLQLTPDLDACGARALWDRLQELGYA